MALKYKTFLKKNYKHQGKSKPKSILLVLVIVQINSTSYNAQIK